MYVVTVKFRFTVTGGAVSAELSLPIGIGPFVTRSLNMSCKLCLEKQSRFSLSSLLSLSPSANGTGLISIFPTLLSLVKPLSVKANSTLVRSNKPSLSVDLELSKQIHCYKSLLDFNKLLSSLQVISRNTGSLTWKPLVESGGKPSSSR